MTRDLSLVAGIEEVLERNDASHASWGAAVVVRRWDRQGDLELCALPSDVLRERTFSVHYLRAEPPAASQQVALYMNRGSFVEGCVDQPNSIATLELRRFKPPEILHVAFRLSRSPPATFSRSESDSSPSLAT
jgi:hypothetical protein